MALRPRVLFGLDLFAFLFGFGLVFGIAAYAGTGANRADHSQAGAQTWEDRLQRSDPAVADKSVTSAVQTALALEPALSGYPLEVTTQNMVVTLRGVVRSAAQRDKAVQAARDTPGVAAVVDKIEVRKDTPPARGEPGQPRAQL